MFRLLAPGCRAIPLLLGALCSMATAAPVRLQDMHGNTVVLAQPARKTVTLPMPASAIFAAVDGGPQGLAGMHPSAHDNLGTMLLPQIYPAFAQVRHDITRGGFSPNVESLLQIQPDIVWQWGHMGDELVKPLHAAGLTAATINYGKEENVRRWISLFAESVGKPERGRTLNQWREQMERKVRQQVAAVPASQRLKVLYLTRYKTGLAAAGFSSNFQFDAEVAGGINANTLKVAAPTINIEQLLLWNPDVIMLTNFERGLTPATLFADPLLADISAVRNKRVYKVPAGGYYWDPPSQDSPLYWVWLAKLLYPDAVQLDLRQEMRAAYRLLYDFAPSDAQIDQVLHSTTNQQSAHYQRAFAPATPVAKKP